MQRFPCNSRLTIRPSLGDRTLAVNLQHTYHQPYEDIRLSSAVEEFIQEQSVRSTPAHIFRALQESQPSGWQTVSQAQVYNFWHRVNSGNWHRAEDPVDSAKALLSEYKEYTTKMYYSGNMQGLAFYVSDAIRTLAPRAKELAMDATFGTNNLGMDLQAVLAEVDGTGVPLAYCFTNLFRDNGRGQRRSESGALAGILVELLQPLRNWGFQPTFVGIDKDPSEIWAVQQVWPETTIQLCYWHAKRAVNMKLTSTHGTAPQADYWPDSAKDVISDFEICWGSKPIRRADATHRQGLCNCPSRSTDFSSAGRVETSTKAEQNTVLSIFVRHFNCHPLIPDQDGTFRSAEELHRHCASEMYHWCHKRNYYRLWAYLWNHWYQPSQWKLWARSVNPTEIPVLKTTMIVESHWRKVKHDYLHRYNRPRVDLVVWVLVSSLIPSVITKMHAVIQHNYRQANPSWRKKFKVEWKNQAEKVVDPSRVEYYHTDPARWTCGCLAFLNSRFLVCKHLLACIEPISNRIDFFRNVQRQRQPPFWTHPQLVLLPQYQPSQAAIEADKANDDDCDEGEEVDAETNEQEHLDDVEEEWVDSEEEVEEADDEPDPQAFLAALRSVMEVYGDQLDKGNEKFLKLFMKRYASLPELDLQLKARKNRRTMQPTWSVDDLLCMYLK
jgi:hypothetical protein